MAEVEVIVTEENRAEWAALVASFPPNVREVAEKFFPWKVYRMQSTGHRVTIASFNEEKDGKVSLRVNVTGDLNLVMFERTVFGVPPKDLVECEFPAKDERVGVMMTPEQQKAYIAEKRAEFLREQKEKGE